MLVSFASRAQHMRVPERSGPGPRHATACALDALKRPSAHERNDVALRIKRIAEAGWNGTPEEGGGQIALGSKAFRGPYSLRSRIEGAPQTSPEELLGAAHAGCFTTSLASRLSRAGWPPGDLHPTAVVHLEATESGYSITLIEFQTTGVVPGVDDATFAKLALDAKETCPVSRALAGTSITLETRLIEPVE